MVVVPEKVGRTKLERTARWDDDPSSRCHQPQAAIAFVSSIASQPAGTLVDLVLSINFRRVREMGFDIKIENYHRDCWSIGRSQESGSGWARLPVFIVWSRHCHKNSPEKGARGRWYVTLWDKGPCQNNSMWVLVISLIEYANRPWPLDKCIYLMLYISNRGSWIPYHTKCSSVNPLWWWST